MADEIAVPSTAPDATVAPISASDALASLSSTERQAWKETGALPADKFAVTDAASPAAEPDVQAAPEGAEIASKPIIATKPKKNADTRVEELLAERAQLRRELELAARKPAVDVAKPVVSSATTDAEPTVEQFATYEKFVQAQARWAARQELAVVETARGKAAEQTRVQQKQHERVSAFSTQLTDAQTADPTFMEKVSAEIQGFKPFANLAPGEVATVDNGIAEELLDSPVAAQLLVHLSAHPEALATLRACTTPRALARAIGTLESQYVGKSAPVAALKTIPGAPAPPTTIGTRPAVTADAVESAISRRDQKAYTLAMNARELAAK